MKKLQSFFLNYSLVAFYLLGCGVFYERGLQSWNQEYAILDQQLKQLNEERWKALTAQQDLLLRVNSQSDPAWVELILMKGLGLTPQDEVKVVFQ